MRVIGISLLFLTIFFLQVCKDPEPNNQALDLFLIKLVEEYPIMEKGACPGNEVVHIFPPGTHSVNLTAGERYYFNLTIAYVGSSYEISYAEDPGENIAAYTLVCSGGPDESLIPSTNDSGLNGQTEEVVIGLKINYSRVLGVLISSINTTTNLTLPSSSYFE